MNKFLKQAIVLVGLLVIAHAGIGCTGYSVTGGPGKTVNPGLVAEPSRSKDLVSVNAVVIAPIVFTDNARPAMSMSSELYSEVTDVFAAATDLQIVGTEEVVASSRRVGGSSIGDATSVSLIDPLAVARKVRADAILKTTVHDLHERVGSRIGSDDPARVHFSLALIRVKDGATVWEANYHFDDMALTDNLFRIGKRMKETHGAGWRSAREIFRAGLDAGARDLTAQRVAQFGAS